MEDKENNATEEVSREEMEAHIKKQWMRMWSEEIVEIRERFQRFKQNPDLVKKIGEMIVKDIGEK